MESDDQEAFKELESDFLEFKMEKCSFVVLAQIYCILIVKSRFVSFLNPMKIFKIQRNCQPL